MLEKTPADIRDGWQLKPYAILNSRFEEVLFLDADQVPARDPTIVFDWPEYRDAGAVFWPDIIDLRADNPIWAALELAGESCPSYESGQMLIDKRRHWRALQMALYLNERADVVHHMIYGDKDTFLVAWRAARAQAALVPHRPFNDYRILVQRDFDGVPLFQHRTGAKWSYHEQQYELSGFVHRDACLGFLADLRRVWNGRMFFPPDRSLAARQEERRLAQTPPVRLTLLGDHEVTLDLLPGCQIGEGRSVDRQNWYVVDGEKGFELIIHDCDRLTHRLQYVRNGVWSGERLATPVAEVRLDEAPRATPEHAPCTNGLVRALVAASRAATDEENGELAAALRLLLRAEPGVRAEIEALAQSAPALRAMMESILAGAEHAKIGSPASTWQVIQAGYTSPGGADP